MLELMHLPPELLHAIFSTASPDDLVNIGLVNHWFHDFVKDNNALHRTVYRALFDEPPTADLDWVRELRDFQRLKSLCSSKSPKKTREIAFVHETVKRLLGHAAHIPADSSDRLLNHRTFQNRKILADLLNKDAIKNAIFRQSFIFCLLRDRTRQLRYPTVPAAEHQMSAELHCLLGAIGQGFREEFPGTAGIYPYAASKVYDMREYTRKSRWGPFMADGSGHVDWEKMEAIIIVLRYNIGKKGLFRYPTMMELWNSPFSGAWPNSYMPIRSGAHQFPPESAGEGTPSEGTPSLDSQDPYGITGTWMRVVCFLDYSEFFRFNFQSEHIEPDRPREPLHEVEELRLIVMKLHVTKIEPPGEDDHPDYPVVHFQGMSYAMDIPWDDNANSGLRGYCRMTKEGQVHWTTFSVFGTEDRWRSESVQLGGIRSGRGVIGNWFDSNYDAQGPCGPTAFWKLHEKTEEDDSIRSETIPFFLEGAARTGFNIVINFNHHHGDNNDNNAGDFEMEIQNELGLNNVLNHNIHQLELAPLLGTLLEQFLAQHNHLHHGGPANDEDGENDENEDENDEDEDEEEENDGDNEHGVDDEPEEGEVRENDENQDGEHGEHGEHNEHGEQSEHNEHSEHNEGHTRDNHEDPSSSRHDEHTDA